MAAGIRVQPQGVGVAIEIERKFLVSEDDFSDCLNDFQDFPSVLIEQGYLNRNGGSTVRVRVSNQEGFLSVKGQRVGASRPEFEYSIPLRDAQQLLALCLPLPVKKRRFLVPCDNHVWHVDQFFGRNSGLILAEIELRSEGEIFPKPDWIGREVTSDERYQNICLSARPFQSWLDEEDSLGGV